MQLHTKCNSCQTAIKVKSHAPSRTDLEHELGEYFNVNCPSCANNSKKHINEVEAKENSTVMIFAILIGLILTAILWLMLGAIGVISISIPILIWKVQSNSVHTFNSYMITRTL